MIRWLAGWIYSKSDEQQILLRTIHHFVDQAGGRVIIPYAVMEATPDSVLQFSETPEGMCLYTVKADADV
jgi:lipid-A-disaccharide synthase-like uncharacterized protein